MPDTYTFFVPGLPKPGGSKRAFYNKKLGRSMIVDACDNRDWKNAVAWAGKEAFGSDPPMTGPLFVSCIFYLPRPKAHYRKNGELKPGIPLYHTCRPDATKLWRSTEDALTHIAWQDDSQIAWQVLSKPYTAANIGAEITIKKLPES